MTDEQQKGLDDTPVQDISDSKDEAEKTFLKELDDAEKTPEVAAAPAGKDDKGGDKSKSKFAAAMDAASKPKRKSSMDPILAVSLVVLILASCVVLGNAAYGEFIEKGQTTTVAYGDTVAVQYTGSFNELYEEGATSDRAVVFDTNVKEVADLLKKDENWSKHSWSFTAKDSYSDLSFTVGGDSVLKKFGSATINHKVGDIIKVHIDSADGYELPDASKAPLTKFTDVDKVMDMTAAQFSALYGFTAPTTGIMYITYDQSSRTITDICPFGCSYSVCTINGSVHVVNDFPDTGVKYAFGQKDLGAISFTKQADGKYTLDYSNVKVNENGKCTKVPVFHDNAWVPGYTYKTDKGVLMYKIGETLGSDLNFVIKITKITKA